MYLHLCRATYLAGEILCSVSDMVRLSAILTQITKGDYVSEKYVVHVQLYIGWYHTVFVTGSLITASSCTCRLML